MKYPIGVRGVQQISQGFTSSSPSSPGGKGKELKPEPRTALRFRLCCGNPSSLGRTGSSLWPPTPPASSACGEWERVLGVQGLTVIAVASLLRAWALALAGFRTGSTRAQYLRHIGLVVLRHEGSSRTRHRTHVPPALAGGSVTTGPPGKPHDNFSTPSTIQPNIRLKSTSLVVL